MSSKDPTRLWTRLYPLKVTVAKYPFSKDPNSKWRVRYRYEEAQCFPTWEEAFGYASIAAQAMESAALDNGVTTFIRKYVEEKHRDAD